MRGTIFCLLAAGLLVEAGQAQAPVPTVHEAMKNGIAPQANILWEVSNGAMDDDGKPDAKRVAAAQWSKVADAGQKMRDLSIALATAGRLTVVAPGGALQDEGNPGGSTAAQVQGFIDADPAGFAERSRKLAAVAGDFAAAARGKDVAKLVDLGGSLDQVCEDCHVRYWYPQQAQN